jgi:hypothetical protein
LVRDGRFLVRTLLLNGPLDTTTAYEREMGAERLTLENLTELIAALRQFVRTVVRSRREPFAYSPIGLYGPLTFRALVNADETIRVGVEGTIRELVILQLVFLLHEVGLSQVRMCTAPQCDRIFVRSYRQEFCSLACQKRTNKARLRQVKREREEQRARRQRGSRQGGA